MKITEVKLALLSAPLRSVPNVCHWHTAPLPVARQMPDCASTAVACRAYRTKCYYEL